MKKWIALTLVLVLVVGICGCGKTEPAAQEQQNQIVESVDITGKFAVGFGRADISPQEAVPISGITANGTDRMSTSVHDTLYVSCIAMTDEKGETRLLMSWDLQGSYADVLEPILGMISTETGVPRENMTLTAIHTHSGPAVRDNTVAYMAEYRVMLGVQCIEAAKAAMADRKPAELYYSQVEVEGMNSVRHYTNELEDGSLIHWGDQYRVGTCSVNTTTKHVKEPDRTMYILRFQREGDKDVVLANWRAHPHLFTSASSYRVSADFIGSFRTAAETYHDCYFTYFQGAAGNVNATSKISGELKPFNFSLPSSPASSIKNTEPTTCPPSLFTSLIMASMVPPVAMRSSTINTFCPGFMASLCISITAEPYSKSYSTDTVSHGSLPFFLTGINGLCIL